MENIGIFEAKTNLSSLLTRVAAGAEIVISKRGMPVAILSPFKPVKPNKRMAIEALKAFRKGRSLEGVSSKELIDEGRKY